MCVCVKGPFGGLMVYHALHHFRVWIFFFFFFFLPKWLRTTPTRKPVLDERQLQLLLCTLQNKDWQKTGIINTTARSLFVNDEGEGNGANNHICSLRQVFSPLCYITSFNSFAKELATSAVKWLKHVL